MSGDFQFSTGGGECQPKSIRWRFKLHPQQQLDNRRSRRSRRRDPVHRTAKLVCYFIAVSIIGVLVIFRSFLNLLTNLNTIYSKFLFFAFLSPFVVFCGALSLFRFIHPWRPVVCIGYSPLLCRETLDSCLSLRISSHAVDNGQPPIRFCYARQPCGTHLHPKTDPTIHFEI